MTQIALILTGLTHPKSHERFLKGIDALERHEAEGLLTKSEHEAVKSAINHGLEDAHKNLIKERFTYHGAYQRLTSDEQKLEDSVSWPQCHVVGGYLKRVQASKVTGPLHDAILAYLTEAAPIGARVMALKALIGKRVAGPTKLALERAEHEMTCQVCARGIFANTGRIALHGYQRPGNGWQTASCSGAKELPFEVSRDALGNEIVHAKLHLARLQERARKLRAEELPITLDYSVLETDPARLRGARQTWVDKILDGLTRANWEEMKAAIPDAFKNQRGPYNRERHIYAPFTFDVRLAAVIGAVDHSIEQVEGYIVDQTARFDGWVRTHERVNQEWVASV